MLIFGLIQLQSYVQESERLFVFLHNVGHLSKVWNRKNAGPFLEQLRKEGLILHVVLQFVSGKLLRQDIFLSRVEELINEELLFNELDGHIFWGFLTFQWWACIRVKFCKFIFEVFEIVNTKFQIMDCIFEMLQDGSDDL